jgi:hypothetical protein
MRVVSVPLAVDAKLTVPIGPANLPVRTVILMLLSTPLALLALASLQGVFKFAMPLAIIFVATTVAVPEYEGLWLGSWIFCRLVEPLLPRIVRHSKLARARVRRVGGGVLVGKAHRLLPPLPSAGTSATVPRVGKMAAGLFEQHPGGWSAVVRLRGPDPAPQTDSYADCPLDPGGRRSLPASSS